MNAGERWLREQLHGVPDELLEMMISALEEGAGDTADQLAAGAAKLYSRVVRGSGTREDALPLLAADALFTHAFQARAQDAPHRLPELAARWGGAGALAEILPDHG